MRKLLFIIIGLFLIVQCFGLQVKNMNTDDWQTNELLRQLYDKSFNLQPNLVSTVPTTDTLGSGESVWYVSGTTVRLYYNLEGTIGYLISSTSNYYINVKDYGAKGDNSTNDTIAIQNAITSLTNGGVVFFPKGIYIITAKLVLHSNITLLGVGRQVSIIKSTANGDVAIEGIDVNFVTIEALGIQGAGQWVYPATKGIVLNISSNSILENIVLRDIEVKGFSDRLIYLGSVAYSTLDNVRARDGGTDGIMIEGGDGINMNAPTVKNVGRTGIYIKSPSSISILGGYVEEAGFGVWFEGAHNCGAQGLGVEAAIDRGSGYDGTNYKISGGNDITLISCLSRNDTIGNDVNAPHLLVDTSAVRVKVINFRKVNSATYGAPPYEVDVTGAGEPIRFEGHNFDKGLINGLSNFADAAYYASAAPTSETWKVGNICWKTNPAASGTPGWVCVNRQDTQMRVLANATDTIMEVDATAGMLATDVIGITLDDGSVHWTTIASITDADTLVITVGIPAGRNAPVDAGVFTNRWKAMANLAS